MLDKNQLTKNIVDTVKLVHSCKVSAEMTYHM